MTDARDHPAVEPSRLAIAIPAFGRADAIAGSLSGMAEEARRDGLDVAFYVSDDTPDRSVEDAIRPLIDRGFPIHYRHNQPALRHDRNLIATLLWPDADYVWPIGSNYRVAPGYLARVHEFLVDQDFLFVDEHAGDPRLVPMFRDDEARAFLRDMLWHQTLTGATIYGRRVRAWARSRGGDLVVMPDFPQLSVMLGYASDRAPTIGWFGERALAPASGATTSYWQSRAIDVFVYHWAATIAAFPEMVSPARQAVVIKSHSQHTNLFNTSKLIELKKSGQFRWSSLRRGHFRAAMHVSFWKLIVILSLPNRALHAGGNTLRRLKVRRRS